MKRRTRGRGVNPWRLRLQKHLLPAVHAPSFVAERAQRPAALCAWFHAKRFARWPRSEFYSRNIKTFGNSLRRMAAAMAPSRSGCGGGNVTKFQQKWGLADDRR